MEENKDKELSYFNCIFEVLMYLIEDNKRLKLKNSRFISKLEGLQDYIYGLDHVDSALLKILEMYFEDMMYLSED